MHTQLLYRTKRLTIEKINLLSDATNLLAIHNDLKTMRWIPNNKANWTLEDITNKYAKNITLYAKNIGLYKINHIEENKITNIGEIGLFPFQQDPSAIEIGYILHHPYWNKGLGTELLLGLEIYLKQNTSYRTIIAQLYEENKASECLLQKVNYQLDSKETLSSSIVKLRYKKELY